MIHQRLLQELDEVARRYRRLYVWTALSASWLVAALSGAAVLAGGWKAGWTLAWAAPTLAIVAFAATVVAVALALRSARDLRWTARRIEAEHPDLQTLLLAAMEQKPRLPDGQFGFLQQSVIVGALSHGRRNDWQEVVPSRRIRLMQVASLGGLVLLVLVVSQMASYASQRTRFAVPPAGSSSSSGMPFRVTVMPGDTEIERATTLIVTARFEGALPDEATLVCRDVAGETIRSPMSLSLSDPMFGGRVAGVRSDLSYRVEYGGQATRDYRVTVYEHPELERADARLVFPAYTALADKFVEDTRRITAVEGTELTLLCRLNKPVASARLVGEDGRALVLAAAADDPTVYQMTHTLENSARYRLHLVDADRRSNKHPPEFVFNVTRNRPPDIKVEIPARDVRVSPIEELDTKASVWDDFGLRAYGISFALAGDPPQDVVLGEPAGHPRGVGPDRMAGRGPRRDAAYLIDFEALQAEPDRLAWYYFWAEDIAPNGEPRRTFSDMYFAEVRHFEEIFRQGQQPTREEQEQREREQRQRQQQGEGNTVGRAEQLAEQQKQIINATWKVIRREVEAATNASLRCPTAEFAADAEQLRTAQQEALDQLLTLAQGVDDAESQQHAADVGRQMSEAITRLSEALKSASAAPLRPALAAEQAAYQGLLKLRAREYEVIRTTRRPQGQQPQSGSASGPQSRSQQQLQQLQLSNSENRYETERQAQAQQEQAQSQTRQVLDRLRELARRQNDLNQRLRELQSALQEAETEQQREEIQRELKRLRQQQEQILRDTDELSQRMQQGENQERMAQSRQNLEQTRENIRQTSEALRQGQVSRAVASGARAGRELEQIREEFRRQASDRFSEEVRQLRSNARRLDENENGLAERLRNLDQAQSEAGGLRDSGEREQIRDGFQRQREDLGRLLENMQNTIEEAEGAEPLMTERLYDTLRNTRQQRLEDALEVTRTLVDRGLVDQARAAQSQAGRGVKELRRGVEEAAEGVLGDEAEALRRARDTLTDLAHELNEEIRRGENQDRAGQQSGNPRASDRQQEGQQQDGQRQGGQQRDRQQQAGQRQGGQPAGGRRPEDQQNQPTDQPPDEQLGSGRLDQQDGQNRGGRLAPVRVGGLDRPASPGRGGGGYGIRTYPPTALGPISGTDFIRWSDRLRDVEEMLEDRELRAEAARIRDRAQGIRRELRRDFKGPSWDIVRELIAEPLGELRDRVAEELRRRQAKETSVPIDRDPVPPKYADQVRRYYEQLGSGR
jgi:hypothetical protein